MIAVTAKVITRVDQKKRFQCCIRSRVLATTTMKVAETVENPTPMIAASRPV